MLNIKETIPAYRLTFVVDEDTMKFLGKSHGYQMDGELWFWEDTKEIQYEVFKPCEDCGSRSMMETDACPYNEGFCLDCCFCTVHYPENYFTCPACECSMWADNFEIVEGMEESVCEYCAKKFGQLEIPYED